MQAVNTMNSIFIHDMKIFDETTPVALEIPSNKIHLFWRRLETIQRRKGI